MPTSNVDYWSSKIERNVRRDERHLSELADMGWDQAVVWECELPAAAQVLVAHLSRLKEGVTADCWRGRTNHCG